MDNELKKLIGKTISKIEGPGNELTFTFSDGSKETLIIFHDRIELDVTTKKFKGMSRGM